MNLLTSVLVIILIVLIYRWYRKNKVCKICGDGCKCGSNCKCGHNRNDAEKARKIINIISKKEGFAAIPINTGGDPTNGYFINFGDVIISYGKAWINTNQAIQITLPTVYPDVNKMHFFASLADNQGRHSWGVSAGPTSPPLSNAFRIVSNESVSGVVNWVCVGFT